MVCVHTSNVIWSIGNYLIHPRHMQPIGRYPGVCNGGAFGKSFGRSAQKIVDILEALGIASRLKVRPPVSTLHFTDRHPPNSSKQTKVAAFAVNSITTVTMVRWHPSLLRRGPGSSLPLTSAARRGFIILALDIVCRH